MNILKRRVALFRVLLLKVPRDTVKSLAKCTEDSMLAFSSDYTHISYARAPEDKWNNKRRVKVSLSKFIMSTDAGRKWAINEMICERTISEISEYVAQRGEAINLKEYPVNYPNDNITLGYKLFAGKDIINIYAKEVGQHSCMTGRKASHTKLYSLIPQARILVVVRDGCMNSRAMYWQTDSGEILLDRVYPNNGKDAQLLRNYAQLKGWVFRTSDEATFDPTNVLSKKKRYTVTFPYSLTLKLRRAVARRRYSSSWATLFSDVFPYVDTLPHLSANRTAGTLTLSNSRGCSGTMLHNHMVGKLGPRPFYGTTEVSTRCDNCGKTGRHVGYSMEDGQVKTLCSKCCRKIAECSGCGLYFVRPVYPGTSFSVRQSFCKTCTNDVNRGRGDGKICVVCGAISTEGLNGHGLCGFCVRNESLMQYFSSRPVTMPTPTTSAPRSAPVAKSITGAKTAAKVAMIQAMIAEAASIGTVSVNHHMIYNRLSAAQRLETGLKSPAYVYFYMKLMETNGLISMGPNGYIRRRAA